MEEYSLSLVVKGLDLDDEFQNAGLECLSYDVIASRTGGVTRVDAELQAASAIDALLQVISDLRSVNVTVMRVEPDLVDVPEIAERLDVSRETARLWSVGARRKGFPAHYCMVGSSRLWFWSDVYEWARAASIEVDDKAPLPSNALEALNGAMAHMRSKNEDGWLMPNSAPVAHIAQRQVRHQQGWRTVKDSA